MDTCVNCGCIHPDLASVQRSSKVLFQDISRTRPMREELYKQFHQRPEIAFQEVWTSQKIYDELVSWGIEVVRVGKTGLVATIKNGRGPRVCMRADIDGLPVLEISDVPYASTHEMIDEKTGEKVHTCHACGHDFHIMSLLSCLQLLNEHKELWQGTYVGIFQPAEEIGAGALRLLKDGIGDVVPKPCVYLGQHVMPTIAGGCVSTKTGAFFSSAYSIKVTIHGTGGHGSMPECACDPIVVAASIIMRLQTIISREMPSSERVVLTVGAIHAGTKANIIPDTATLLLNTRCYNADLEQKLFSAIERVIQAECEASSTPCPADIEYFDRGPLTENSVSTTTTLIQSFETIFGDEFVPGTPQSVSEDFSYIPRAWECPYTFWTLGGFKDMEHAPANHSPHFVPALQPTLDRGLEACIVAALTWLARS